MTKDLFFSGHTATVFLLFLNSQTKLWKNVFLTLTILVGFCVLIQHVHYTVDVIAAPFFGYGAFVIARGFVKRVQGKYYFN
jgi:membrane-associated phospholipid phosphatase